MEMASLSVRPKAIPPNPDAFLVISLPSEASRAVPLALIKLNYSFINQSDAIEGNDAI